VLCFVEGEVVLGRILEEECSCFGRVVRMWEHIVVEGPFVGRMSLRDRLEMWVGRCASGERDRNART
jgi:hypothetical protein